MEGRISERKVLRFRGIGGEGRIGWVKRGGRWGEGDEGDEGKEGREGRGKGRGKGGKEERTDRVAALCSEVWQKRKRSSWRDLEKAYLDAIAAVACVEGREGGMVWLGRKRGEELDGRS